MGIMRWAIYDRLKVLYPNVELTYGYITKSTRIGLKLEKSHKNDAYCIAGNVGAGRSTEWYMQKYVRRNNRQLHKATIGKGGIRKSNKAPYILHGFRLFDKIRYEGKESFVFGRRTSGYFDLRKLDGTKVHASAQSKKLKLLETSKTILTERKNMETPSAHR
jgi:N6-L-threonylcarbamoyladenine synthase